MNYFTTKVYDDTWTIYVVDENDNVIADETSEAETDFEKSEIYFRPEGIKLTTVRHELWHLFFHYTFTTTASLAALEMEEVSAELFCYQADKILKLADEVYSELVKLRDQKDL